MPSYFPITSSRRILSEKEARRFTVLNEEIISSRKRRLRDRLSSFKERFARLYTLSFPPDGIDLAIHSTDDGYWASKRERATDPFVMVTTFLGLPNRTHSPSEKLSLLILCKNFVGYRDNQHWLATILLPIIMVPLHLISVPVKFLTNVARLFTEMLPQLLREVCILTQTLILLYFAMSEYAMLNSNKPRAIRIAITIAKGIFIDFPAAMLFGVAALVFLLTYPLYYVGRAVTSPIDSARGDWVKWRSKEQLSGFGQVFSAFVAAAVRIATAAIVFAFLLPLTAKVIGLLFAPLVATHTPAAIAAMIHFFTILGNTLAPGVVSVFSAPLVGLALIAAATSAAIASVGLMLKDTYLKALSWFYRPTKSGGTYVYKAGEGAQYYPTQPTFVVSSTATAQAGLAAAKKQPAPTAPGSSSASSGTESTLTRNYTAGRTTSGGGVAATPSTIYARTSSGEATNRSATEPKTGVSRHYRKAS